MPLSYLLDTNICIYVAKHRPPRVAERLAGLAVGTVGMSLITYGELRYGAEKSSRRTESIAILERLVEIIEVVDAGPSASEQCGVVRAHLERAGTPIGNNDLWIAAHALALDVTLVTNNTREFERVPSLRLENWVV